MCVCASMRPGSTVTSPRSMTFASRGIESPAPTAATLSPSTIITASFNVCPLVGSNMRAARSASKAACACCVAFCVRVHVGSERRSRRASKLFPKRLCHITQDPLNSHLGFIHEVTRNDTNRKTRTHAAFVCVSFVSFRVTSWIIFLPALQPYETDSGGRGFLRRPPAQDGLARGCGLVEATDARGARRVQNRFGFFDGLARDLLHRFDELLKLCATDRLGRLDEHRALHDEREVDGHRVEAVINQALRDVERVDAFAQLPLVGEENLVHRRRAEGLVERIGESVRDEARVQDGGVRRLAPALGARPEDV